MSKQNSAGSGTVNELVLFPKYILRRIGYGRRKFWRISMKPDEHTPWFAYGEFHDRNVAIAEIKRLREQNATVTGSEKPEKGIEL